MTFKKKVWSSAAELTWTKCLRRIVNSDRQFYGTVHVISWTIVLISSSRKSSEKGDLRKINMHVFVLFQDFVGKNKELFCLKPGQIWQRRGIYLRQGIWICEVNEYWKSVHWWIVYHQWKKLSDSGLFVERRKRRSKQANSRLMELWASQWYMCLAVLREVNFEWIC